MRKRLTLSFLSALVALLMIEGYLTLFAPIEYLRPPKKLPEPARSTLIHRHSTVPGLAYELEPNLSAIAVGVLVETNSYGMRDEEPRSGEDLPAYRILALGDSFTIGYGVEEDEAYPSVLEVLLNQATAERPYEILNLAVGGYTTHDEALVLEHKGLQWDPDLIIIGYVLNDPEIDPLQTIHRHFQEPYWWQHSNIVRLGMEAKHNWDIERLGNGDYFKYLHSPDTKQWQSVLAAFNSIGNITRDQDIPVLLIVFPHLFNNQPWADYPYRDQHTQIAEAAEAQGFFVLDLLDTYEQTPASVLTLSKTDPHPSFIGHQLSAQAIYAWLLDHPEILSN